MHHVMQCLWRSEENVGYPRNSSFRQFVSNMWVLGIEFGSFAVLLMVEPSLQTFIAISFYFVNTVIMFFLPVIAFQFLILWLLFSKSIYFYFFFTFLIKFLWISHNINFNHILIISGTYNTPPTYLCPLFKGIQNQICVLQCPLVRVHQLEPG